MTEIMPFSDNNCETVLLDRPFMIVLKASQIRKANVICIKCI